MPAALCVKQLRRAFFLAPLGLALFTVTAHAATWPTRKPGFWQTTMTMHMTVNGQQMGNGTPNTMYMCSDAAVDAMEEKQMAGDSANCSKFSISGGNGAYTMDGSCPDPMGGGGTMVTHGTLTMAGDSAARVDSTTTSAHMSGHMVGDSKWIGACPAGVMPGDLGHMDNGQFVKMTNILHQDGAPTPP